MPPIPRETPRRVHLGTANPPLTGPKSGEKFTLLSPAQTQTLVSRELEQWEKDLQSFYDTVNASWALWNLQPVDPNTNPFLSQIQSAYPLYAVEQILPRILGENPTMNYAPLDNERDSLIATILGKVASAQMKRMGFEYQARDFIRQALVAKYSVGKLYWVRHSELRDTTIDSEHPFVDDEEHLGTYKVSTPSKERVVTVNEPRFEVVNVLDFVWPLTAKSINDAPAVWQRRWIPLGELQVLADEGVYQNIDQITSSDTNRWTAAYDPQFASQGLTVTPPASLTNDADDPDALIEVHERWTDGTLITVASRRVNIRYDPNPFDHKRKPFIDYTPIPRPFQMHGQSIIDTVKDSNDSLSTLIRQVADAITYLITPAFKSTGGVDWNNFTFQPGAHLDLDETEDVEPLVTPTVDFAAALQWRQAHLDDMQRNSGVFDIQQGFATGGTHTATGVSNVIQNATMRITEMVNVFSYRSMRPFGWMLERLNAQYLDEGMLVDISDDPQAQQAWQEFAAQEEPQGILRRSWDRLGFGNGNDQTAPLGMVRIHPDMVRAQGRLEPIPQVGQDKVASDTQKRSDASQALQAIAPVLASPQNPVNMAALVDWALQQFGVPEEVRQKIEQTPQPQQMKAITDALPNGATSGPSGPSGDNAPTGGVVGAPGAAGGVGPTGLGSS